MVIYADYAFKPRFRPRLAFSTFARFEPIFCPLEVVLLLCGHASSVSSASITTNQHPFMDGDVPLLRNASRCNTIESTSLIDSTRCAHLSPSGLGLGLGLGSGSGWAYFSRCQREGGQHPHPFPSGQPAPPSMGPRNAPPPGSWSAIGGWSVGKGRGCCWMLDIRENGESHYLPKINDLRKKTAKKPF